MQLAWSSGTRLGPGHRNTMKRRTKQCHTQMSRTILLQYSRPLNDRKGVYFLSWTASCSSFGKIRMSLFLVFSEWLLVSSRQQVWQGLGHSAPLARQGLMTRSYVGHSLLESVQYRLRPDFVEDFAICFFLALLLDIPSSRSPGSPEAVVKGLEWIIASTSHMSVRNDSSSKQWPYSSIKPERTFLVILIWRSHTPPMWLAADGLKIQSMFSFSNLTRISSWSTSSTAWSNSFHAPTKFVPLSLLICLTGPRRLWSAGVLE